MGEIISDVFAPEKGKSSKTAILGLLIAVIAGVGVLTNLLTLISSAGSWLGGIFNPGEYDNPVKLGLTLFLYILGLLLGVFSGILALTKKYQFASIALIIQAILQPIGIFAIWQETPVATIKFAIDSFSYGIFSSFGTFTWFIDYIVHPLLVIPAIAIAVITLIRVKPEKNFVVSPAPASNPELVNNNSAVTSDNSIPTTKGKTNMSAQYEVMIPGITDPKVDVATLQAWARSGRIKANTLVKEISTGATFNAAQIPGVFSDKQYTTALILSILLGTIGVDRFYTGHVGIGVGKLLTLGGCGVWALVDIILYATRKVTDSEGNPLS